MSLKDSITWHALELANSSSSFFFLQRVMLQRDYSLLTHSILMATSLKPLSSNRWIILPTRPRCTPSGFTMIKVRSLFSAMINLQMICSKVVMEHTTMRCLASREWTRTRRETRGEKPGRRWGRARRDVPVVVDRLHRPVSRLVSFKMPDRGSGSCAMQKQGSLRSPNILVKSHACPILIYQMHYTLILSLNAFFFFFLTYNNLNDSGWFSD